MKGAKALQEFEEYLRLRDKSPRTIEKYVALVRQMLEWLDISPKSIGQEDIDRYKLYMKGIYDVNSIAPIVSAIKQFLTMLGKKKIEIKAPNRQRKNVVPLTPKEIERIFSAAYDEPMDHAILTTLYFGQLRQNELVHLNISDVDFERQKLRINDGKGSRSDEINMHPVGLKSIQRYIQTTRIQPIENGDPLFVSREGLRLSRTPVWKRVKKYAIKANITKRCYPHLFRHSSITNMAANGATLAEIQRQSRHKDVKTLMQYIHPSEKRVRDVYMRTVDINVPPTLNEAPVQEKNLPLPDRAMQLLDALCSGRIDNESYKMAMETLNKQKV